ncbi:hypothetical protein [Legionella sp. km772]|uniref:hypothetical protein n=1 Tax=Legionella sp. km772 TaxID=2498111 RepID=UPI000F9ED8A4|nr:hypothetical protein [Legionella sp. km772]RUR09116.1 hypothetical protein ELY15_09655 [Legionella sp. km772]
MHKIRKGYLAGDSRVFYHKEMELRSVAYLELLAQEFFRLIIPSQPETRIASHPYFSTYVILSEEIAGYKPLPVDSPANFTKGFYPGLGQIMITSIFLQEIDLKNGNICLNKNNHVIKIDGDWCFAAMRDSSFKHYKKAITPELLATLPYPFGYSAFNWLDMTVKGVAQQSSRMVEDDLASAPHFRQEINEAMLKILLLPDDYIKKFVDAFIPFTIKADLFIDYIKTRREELKHAALQDDFFKLYLKSRLAKEHMNQHLLQMQSFVANGNYPIMDVAEYELLEDQVSLTYDNLYERAEVDSESLNSFSRLNELKIDFSATTSKKRLVDYRDLLLKKINNCIESFSKSSDNSQEEQSIRLIQLAEEKRKLVYDSFFQLEKRFIDLEQLGFDAHIKLFTKKQKEMSIKSLGNPKYSEAARKAHLLCNRLQQARNNFTSLDKPFEQAKKDFKRECLLAVKDARAILDNHREWKGKIKKFIIDIISFLTAGLSAQLGLFGKTDSGAKLDNLEQLVSKNFN